jgi:hypothetical protein
MRVLTQQEMRRLEGGTFWNGFLCGIALVAAAASGGLDPLLDLAAIGTCGAAFE